MEELGVVENGKAYKFEYHGNDITGTDKLDQISPEERNLDNYVLLATFKGESEEQEKSVQILYNPQGKEVYLCVTDADGTPDPQQLYDMFPDEIPLEEGAIYTIKPEYAKWRLSSTDEKIVGENGGYWDKESNSINEKIFQKSDGQPDGDFLNGMKAVKPETQTDAGSQDSTDAVGGFILGDSTEENIDDVAGNADGNKIDGNDSNDSSSSGDSSDSSSEVDGQSSEGDLKTIVGRDGNSSAADEAEVVETESLTEVVSETPVASNNGGLVAGLVVVSVLAVAAIAGCVVLWMKQRGHQEEGKKNQGALEALKKEKETMLKEKQDLQAKINELQQRVDSMQSGTQQNANANTELQRENSSLKAQLETLKEKYLEIEGERDRLDEKCSNLGKQNVKLSNQLTQLSKAAEVLERQSEISAPRVEEDIPEEPSGPSEGVLISTTVSKMQEYQGVVFLTSKVGFSGALIMTISPYKIAQLVAIGDDVYLNPYNFQKLAEGKETHSNLIGLKDVFDIEGLRTAFETYSLVDIEPAKIVKNSSGSYELQQKGRLILEAFS